MPANLQTVQDDEIEEERVFKLPEEIQTELARIKRRPPKDIADLVNIITGSIFPIVGEMAHYLKENSQLLYELMDRIDGGGSDETQFQPEHAAKFDLIVTYAKGVAQRSLESGEIPSGSEAHQQLVKILSTAEECLKIIEESTLEPDDEGGDGDLDRAEAGQVEKN